MIDDIIPELNDLQTLVDEKRYKDHRPTLEQQKERKRLKKLKKKRRKGR